MPEPIYVPVLKGKQGELGALVKIQSLTRKNVLPLLEIVPSATDERPALRDGVDRTIRKLQALVGGRIMLDTGLLPPEVDLGDKRGPTGYALDKARERGVNAVPVVRLSNDARVEAEVAQSHVDHGSGTAVRLVFEDMDEDGDDIDAALGNLLNRLGLHRPDVDLVLDLGAIDGDLAVRALARLVRDVVGELRDVTDYRLLVVTSGAFPADLSGVAPWTIGDLPRRDATLWDQIQRRRIPRVPAFGDYGVSHPLLANGPAFSPAPQLRYTVSDRWLAMKGKRNDPRGHAQFYEICDDIAAHADFSGPALGSADAWIADPRSHGTGNAATWREIGTTHHLDYVVQRLTNLGEP